MALQRFWYRAPPLAHEVGLEPGPGTRSNVTNSSVIKDSLTRPRVRAGRDRMVEPNTLLR